MKKFIFGALIMLSLASCKNTFYDYEVEKMNKGCKDHGGLNRFGSDLNDIWYYCNDGTFNRIRN